MSTNHTLWLPYTQMKTARVPLEVVATQAEFLITKDGRKLIDAIGSWWTSCHGYNHPVIIKAIAEQAQTMPHVMLGGITHPQAARLSERLKNLLPGDLNHVFFANTGSESVEIALKMAIQYWLNQGLSRDQFVCFQNGYHGDTLYAMSVCDPEEGMHHLFNNVLPKQLIHKIPETQTDLEIFNTWLEKHKSRIAGVIIEPLLQGAGGMKLHTPETLRQIYTICKAHGLLFITDEIFTGFGRTGTLFAIDQAGIVPDIICLSKALTGGTLPLAATIARTPIFEAFFSDDPNHALMHGPTYMGNALACAAANASLDLFETLPWQENVRTLSKHFQETLKPLEKSALVKQVRVIGAMAAVQLIQPIGKQHNAMVDYFLQQGIWLRPMGDIIYATPSFQIDSRSLTKITTAISMYIHSCTA